MSELVEQISKHLVSRIRMQITFQVLRANGSHDHSGLEIGLKCLRADADEVHLPLDLQEDNELIWTEFCELRINSTQASIRVGDTLDQRGQGRVYMLGIDPLNMMGKINQFGEEHFDGLTYVGTNALPSLPPTPSRHPVCRGDRESCAGKTRTHRDPIYFHA